MRWNLHRIEMIRYYVPRHTAYGKTARRPPICISYDNPREWRGKPEEPPPAQVATQYDSLNAYQAADYSQSCEAGCFFCFLRQYLKCRSPPDRFTVYGNFHEFVWKGIDIMNTDMKAYVLDLLSPYPKRKREIEVLRYELTHPAQVSPADQLEAMNYAHGNTDGKPSTGHVSDKTLFIALNYQEKAEKLNASVVNEVSGLLYKAQQEQSRLEYYVSLLEPRQAEVIRRTFFEPEPQEAIAKYLNISVRTVQTDKTQAIDTLVELYSLTDKQR